MLSRNNIEDHVNAIVNENSESTRLHQELISLEDLNSIYTNVLLPWTRGNYIRGTFMYQAAQEFNPDPFNAVADIQDKWLSSSSLMRCVSDMQDMQLLSLNGRVNIYNLGPYARSSFLRAQRRTVATRQRRRDTITGLGYMDDYVSSTFGEQRFTRIL